MMIPVRMARQGELLSGGYVAFPPLQRKKVDGIFKLGQTDRELSSRIQEHHTSNPGIEAVYVFRGLTKFYEDELHGKLLEWRLPGTREWYYSCEPCWREILHFCRMQKIEIVMLGPAQIRTQGDLFEG
jgi:hypothetical protein